MNSLMSCLQNNDVNYIEYGKNSKRTFNEIYDDVLLVSCYLREKGIACNDRIGLLCSNCYEYILIDLACILCGYVLVSFHLSDYRCSSNNLLDTYNLKLLIVDETEVKINSDKEIILKMDQIISEIATLDKYCINKLPKCSPFTDEDLFSIIFTSGSTGSPKSLAVKFKCPSEFIRICINKFKMNNTDKVLLFLPMSQFSSRCYVYAAIMIGFNIAVVRPDELMWGLRKYKPTAFQAVPFVYEQLHESFRSILYNSKTMLIFYYIYLLLKKVLPRVILTEIQQLLFKNIYATLGGNIRFMISGAAPICPNILKAFRDFGLTIYEGYGLVETGMIALNYEEHNRIGSVGKVLDNKSVEIDENGQIIVRSHYLWGNRYINAHAEDSAKIFIDKNCIATGDVGHIDKDGYLFITGRMKDIIILSTGCKIHPLLIEKKLCTSALIKQAVVLGDYMSSLVAVIVCNDNACTYEQLKPEIVKVNKTLAAEYKIKKFLISEIEFTIENGMMTSNMKINRKKVHNYFKEYMIKYDNM